MRNLHSDDGQRTHTWAELADGALTSVWERQARRMIQSRSRTWSPREQRIWRRAQRRRRLRLLRERST